MNFNFNFNEFYDHNFGDFVHIHTLREWFKGVPSLDKFLKSKDDKAIVKDMHFTDERTTVDYIDTKDNTEKSETLCEYLTSDVSAADDTSQFKKVDKIKFLKNNFNETFITVREKDTKKERVDFIRSNIPVAYDATDDYQTSSKTYHIGINENGVIIYDDDTLEVVRAYDFTSGSSTPVNVIERNLSDCDPFSSVTDTTGDTSLQLHKTGDFHATIVKDTVISGQICYAISGGLRIEPKKYVVLQLNPGSMSASGLSFSNVYPKYAQVEHNTKGLITQITSVGGFPVDNGSPTFLTIYNQTEDSVDVENIHFTF